MFKKEETFGYSTNMNENEEHDSSCKTLEMKRTSEVGDSAVKSSPLAEVSLHVYMPLSSSCTELRSSLHLFPSKCILQLSRAGWISFPSASQSTSVSSGPITWHSNMTVSPASAVMSFTGRMMARPGSTGGTMGCTGQELIFCQPCFMFVICQCAELYLPKYLKYHLRFQSGGIIRHAF